MPASAARLRGISEVGHITDPTGAPTDVPWGKTQQEGVTLQLSTETVDLMSAQATMKEDSGLVSTAMQLVIRMITAELQLLQRLYGIPAASFSGDLEDVTPTPEVLSVAEGDLGSQEESLYVLGTGPASTRRVEAARCRVVDLGGLNFASTSYQTPEGTWEVLAPASGDVRPPLEITDAV